LERVDARDRLPEGARDVGVRLLAEPDVAVAHLDERELARFGRGAFRRRPEDARGEEASAHGPDEPGADPRHAGEKAAAVDPVVDVIVEDAIFHERGLLHFTMTSPVMCGWTLQK